MESLGVFLFLKSDRKIQSLQGYGGVSDSGETSRRSTISRMDVAELIRDIEVKNKYPELYKMMMVSQKFDS